MPSLSQVRALKQLGLDRYQRREFCSEQPVIYERAALQGDMLICVVQLDKMELRSGIFSINDRGTRTGFLELLLFIRRSRSVALAFNLRYLEVFGIAIINPQLEAALLQRGFIRKTVEFPETIPLIGGESLEVLSKSFILY